MFSASLHGNAHECAVQCAFHFDTLFFRNAAAEAAMHCIGEGYGAVWECRALGRSTPKVPLRAGRAPGRAANGRNGTPDHQTLSMLHRPLQMYPHHQHFSLLLHNNCICTKLHEYERQSSRNPTKVMLPVTSVLSKVKGPKKAEGVSRGAEVAD